LYDPKHVGVKEFYVILMCFLINICMFWLLLTLILSTHASTMKLKMQMFVNDCVHSFHRQIRLLCNFTTGHASITQDQSFHALNVHRNDCCGLGTTTAGIVTDGRTAIFETFTPFKCLTAAERLITVLCLKSFLDIRGVLRFRSQETSSPHALPCTHYHC